MARGLLDLLLPPMAHDSREATASAGLSPDAWSRVVFLEAPVCDGCGAAFEYDGGDFASDRCLACQVQPYAFARARAACVYDEASRGLILKFKHGDQQQFAPLFARWIARSGADVVAEADAVVPVPLHRSRLLARRFNQAAEIARPLARSAGLDYLPDALIRAAPTASQGGKSARGRRLNVKSAFVVTEAARTSRNRATALSPPCEAMAPMSQMQERWLSRSVVATNRRRPRACSAATALIRASSTKGWISASRASP